MRRKQNLLGAAALGATVAVFGLAMPQQAEAAIVCEAVGPNADPTCTTRITVPQGVFLGNLKRILTPGFDEIVELKEAVGELDGGLTAINLAKWDDSESSTYFADPGIDERSGTIEYTGYIDLLFLNVALGFNEKNLVWGSPFPDVSFGDTFSWSAPEGGSGIGDLSNATAVGVVPVPAALPLLLTALGALGLIGRKKMKATATA